MIAAEGWDPSQQEVRKGQAHPFQQLPQSTEWGGGLTPHLTLHDVSWPGPWLPETRDADRGADGLDTAHTQIIQISKTRGWDWATSGESRGQSWLLGVHGLFLLPSSNIHTLAYFS